MHRGDAGMTRQCDFASIKSLLPRLNFECNDFMDEKIAEFFEANWAWHVFSKWPSGPPAPQYAEAIPL
jgi:hypothetical protein